MSRAELSTCFIPFLAVFGFVFLLIPQSTSAAADQSDSITPIKMISTDTTQDMEGTHSMFGMSNMSGMHEMKDTQSTEGVKDMQGIHNMPGLLGISSDEEVSVFVEWMFVLLAILIGVPFGWVILSQRRKRSRTRSK